jgi:hypothetical protein
MKESKDECILRITKELNDLKIYHEIQMLNAGLLAKAVTDSCDLKMSIKIMNRHFELMNEGKNG